MKPEPVDVIEEIIRDNTHKKGQKAKTGILISYRVLASVILIYLSYLGFTWDTKAEKKELIEKVQYREAIENQQKILIQLAVLTSLVKNYDDRTREVSKRLEEMEVSKADKSSLNRLEDRLDRRLQNSFINFQAVPDNLSTNYLLFEGQNPIKPTL